MLINKYYKNIKGDFLILKEDFEKVLNEYLNAKNSGGTTSHPIAKFISNNLKNDINTLLGEPKCGKGSAGIGNLANMPWLDFTLPGAMNKLGAVNVAYLFKPNMTGFYLTFRVFFYGELDAKYGKYLPLYLKNKSRHIKEFLEESNKLRDDFVFFMDFSENTAVMKKHSAGTIIAKYYEKGNVPSDEELIVDLKYFLELYQFVIDNYEDKTDLSVDEWVEVLENEEIIDEKMFSILNIMHSMMILQPLLAKFLKKENK